MGNHYGLDDEDDVDDIDDGGGRDEKRNFKSICRCKFGPRKLAPMRKLRINLTRNKTL